MRLSRRTVVGVFWTFAEQLARRGVGVIVTMLLAYFVTPEEYGLVAMVAVVIAIASLFMESGLREALIRKESIGPDDYDTAFVANLIMGGLAYAVVFGAAPLVARFYDEPVLTGIVRVVGVLIPIKALQTVQMAHLTREMDFRAQMVATVPASVLSGIMAVGMAAMGAGVWALVSQQIAAASLTSLLLWRASSWRPTWQLSQRAFLEMFDFGYKLLLTGLLGVVFDRSYVVVVGRFFDAVAAGHYFFADRVHELVLSLLVRSIQKATYPALAQLQSNASQLLAGYRRVVSVMMFAMAPAIAFMTLFASDLFAVVLPDSWARSATILSVLSVAGVVMPLNAVNGNLLKVLGRADLLLKLQLVRKVAAVGVLILSIQHGLMGIVVGRVVVTFLNYLPIVHYSGQLLGYTWRLQLRDAAPAIVLGFATFGGSKLCLLLLATSDVSPLISVSVGLFGGTTAYLASSWAFGMESLGFVLAMARRRIGW